MLGTTASTTWARTRSTRGLSIRHRMNTANRTNTKIPTRIRLTGVTKSSDCRRFFANQLSPARLGSPRGSRAHARAPVAQLS